METHPEAPVAVPPVDAREGSLEKKRGLLIFDEEKVLHTGKAL